MAKAGSCNIGLRPSPSFGFGTHRGFVKNNKNILITNLIICFFVQSSKFESEAEYNAIDNPNGTEYIDFLETEDSIKKGYRRYTQ